MMTQSHVAIGLLFAARSGKRAAIVGAIIGGITPDFGMVPMMLVSYFLLGQDMGQIWETTYYSVPWWTIDQITNSAPLYTILLTAALLAGRRVTHWWPGFLSAFALTGLLHVAFDFLTHASDGHIHFWPLSDFIFASPEAVLYIQKVWVRKNPAIPTHAEMGIELSRNKMKKERYFAKTLPSLKKAIEAKVEKDFEEKMKKEIEEKKEEEAEKKGEDEDKNFEEKKEATRKGKALNDAKKEDKEKLHSNMDKAFDDIRAELARLKSKDTLDEYLRRWSKTVEKTMLNHLEVKEKRLKR